MRASEGWLQARLAQNPSLKVSVQGGKQTKTLIAQELQQLPSETKPAKFFNRKVFVYEDGFVSDERTLIGHGKIIEKYDSEKEYRRWKDLILLERSRRIHDLKRQMALEIQPSFVYQGKRIQAITYVADFHYVDEDGCITIEDVKAYDEALGKFRTTKDFDLKWKLLKYRYPDYKFIVT